MAAVAAERPERSSIGLRRRSVRFCKIPSGRLACDPSGRWFRRWQVRRAGSRRRSSPGAVDGERPGAGHAWGLPRRRGQRAASGIFGTCTSAYITAGSLSLGDSRQGGQRGHRCPGCPITGGGCRALGCPPPGWFPQLPIQSRSPTCLPEPSGVGGGLQRGSQV